VLDFSNLGEKNNIRKQYLLGKYTGIPEEPKIDFCSLLNTLNDNAETAHEPSLESRGIDNTRIAGFHPLHEF
jgi:hypothetical protein